MERDPDTIYIHGTDLAYCRVETVPDLDTMFGSGIKIVPGPGHVGGPLLFGGAGAKQLEEIIRRKRRLPRRRRRRSA